MQYYDSTHLEEEMLPGGGEGGSVAGISLAALWDEEENEEELTLEVFDNSSVQVRILSRRRRCSELCFCFSLASCVCLSVCLPAAV